MKPCEALGSMYSISMLVDKYIIPHERHGKLMRVLKLTVFLVFHVACLWAAFSSAGSPYYPQ